MGKQLKAKKLPENLGKGKVTPVQIAFIVDRYLSDNNYNETRSAFRNEASSLIANSPIQEAPKSLLTLGAILNEYISLKEQKMILDQEKVRLEQEKYRVQMLLQGMQNVMNAYNASGIAATPPKSTVASVPQPNTANGALLSGGPSALDKTVTPHQLPVPCNVNTEPTNTSVRKRKESNVVTDAPSVVKRSCTRLSTKRISTTGANTLSQPDNAGSSYQEVSQPASIQMKNQNSVASRPLVQGSSVAKCLFNQPSPPIQNNSSFSKTPPRAKSSHGDNHISPPEISSLATCSTKVASQEFTPTRCTVISSKRVMVSPAKQMAYIERSQCISSCSPLKTDWERTNKREHVRSKLDFKGSSVPGGLDNLVSVADDNSTSGSEKEVDIFDIDFPNLDALGMDFSFTEMLNEFDLHCQGTDFSCPPTSSPAKETCSGSSHESDIGTTGANQVISELSSTTTEVLSEKDMNIQGLDSLMAMKSVTKCIQILSPVKNQRSCTDQENCTRE